jgi:hypothetical protein
VTLPEIIVCATTTPGIRGPKSTYYHYSNQSPRSIRGPGNFGRGLYSGSSATNSPNYDAQTASGGLGIPTPIYVYSVTVAPNDPQFPVVDRGLIPPNSRGPGGLPEVEFPNGTPPGSVGPPVPVQQRPTRP